MKKTVSVFILLALLGIGNLCAMQLGPKERLAAAIVDDGVADVQQILDQITDASIVNENLHLAANMSDDSNFEKLRVLLAFPGVNVNYGNGTDGTILHGLALNKHGKNDNKNRCLRWLFCNAAVDIFAIDRNGNNILHVAASCDNWKAAWIVLDHVSNHHSSVVMNRFVNALNNPISSFPAGTPLGVFAYCVYGPYINGLEWAASRRFEEQQFVKILQKYGANVEDEHVPGNPRLENGVMFSPVAQQAAGEWRAMQAAQESMVGGSPAPQIDDLEIASASEGRLVDLDFTAPCDLCTNDSAKMVVCHNNCQNHLCVECFAVLEARKDIDLGDEHLKVVRRCPFCQEIFYILVVR